MSTKTNPGLLRKKLNLYERFPCEGIKHQISHVKKYEIESRWLERMHSLTKKKKQCKWISCPGYHACDLRGWGEHISERDDAEEMLQKLLPDLASGRTPFADNEYNFLMSLLDVMEMDEHFIPTERQMGWLSSLFERWDRMI